MQEGITFSKELINIAWHKNIPREREVNVSWKNDLMLLVIHRDFLCILSCDKPTTTANNAKKE